MIDIRQSSLYASFMQSIGWRVEVIDDVYFYIKKFPILPAVIKLQRPNKIPDMTKLHNLMHKYQARKIIIEPNLNLEFAIGKLDNSQLTTDPFLPTKTIHLNLTSSEETIFKHFSEAKQRAVRRAEKNNVQVTISDNIEKFIKLKNKISGLLGFMTTKTLKPLWETFSPKHAGILLAYCHPELVSGSHYSLLKLRRSHIKYGMTEKIVAGILLLHFESTACYWIAAATDEGKRLFAPTLLVWEALKLAKKNGCTIFDFEGVYDERFPNTNKEWLGFTRFKQGFGGKEIYFPKPLKLYELKRTA